MEEVVLFICTFIFILFFILSSLHFVEHSHFILFIVRSVQNVFLIFYYFIDTRL